MLFVFWLRIFLSFFASYLSFFLEFAVCLSCFSFLPFGCYIFSLYWPLFALENCILNKSDQGYSDLVDWLNAWQLKCILSCFLVFILLSGSKSFQKQQFLFDFNIFLFFIALWVGYLLRLSVMLFRGHFNWKWFNFLSSTKDQ